MLKMIRLMKGISYLALYGNALSTVFDIYYHFIGTAAFGAFCTLLSIWCINHWTKQEEEYLKGEINV
jgi:hypothetical protein